MTARWGDAASLRETARFVRDHHERHVLAGVLDAVAEAVEQDHAAFADVDAQRVSDDLDALISASYADGVRDQEESFDPIRAFS